MNCVSVSGFHGSLCTIDSDILDPYILSRSNNDASPNSSPSIAPEDMFLLQAPSPLMPYTYTGVPKLSGTQNNNILKTFRAQNQRIKPYKNKKSCGQDLVGK